MGYIDAKTFKEFCENQNELINILNHRMTGIENSVILIKNDVNWTKKILWLIFGVLITAIFGVIFKGVF